VKLVNITENSEEIFCNHEYTLFGASGVLALQNLVLGKKNRWTLGWGLNFGKFSYSKRYPRFSTESPLTTLPLTSYTQYERRRKLYQSEKE